MLKGALFRKKRAFFIFSLLFELRLTGCPPSRSDFAQPEF
jgi:hypothetical protein